jgi:3-oxoacyl-[acyl-carrier-protein] synthase II
VSTGDVALVCAHGTGTVRNDAAEVTALARVLGGSRARVFSIKGHVGHTLGAAGALDALSALLALERGVVPGTARLEAPLDAGTLVLTRGPEPLVDPRFAIAANAGFGGLCGALVFEAVRA